MPNNSFSKYMKQKSDTSKRRDIFIGGCFNTITW
jgi:hypothetical protein